MSYDTKIQAVREIVEKHNAVVADKGKVVFDNFLKALQEQGGTTEEAIKSCSYEDLQKMGLPVLIAKQAAKQFRSDENGKEQTVAYVSEKKAQQLTPKELLERFDPKDPDSTVAKRLKSLSRSKPFIVFNDGSVNVPVSTQLLQEIRDDFPPRENFVDENNEVYEIYAIGQKPNAYASKNPLFSRRILRPDGTCDQTNRSWEGISDEIRQVVYLAVRETSELPVKTIADAHDILDLIMNRPDDLSTRTQKARLLLKKLKETGNAPSLKVALKPSTKSGAGPERNDPFPHKEF